MISLVAVLVVPRQTSHSLLDITCRRLVEKQRRLATSKDRRYATVMADHDLAIASRLERELLVLIEASAIGTTALEQASEGRGAAASTRSTWPDHIRPPRLEVVEAG